MKVLFLNHNPMGYGTYYRCFQLGRHLSRLGYNITLICASEKNFDINISKMKVNDNFDIITLPRIKYHKYYTGQALRTIFGSLYTLIQKYDIIHSFSVAQPSIGIPTLISKALRKRIIICDWDDLWGGGFAEYHNFAVRKVLETLERITPLMTTDKMTVVSEFLFDRAKAIGMSTSDIFKIPNGSNVDGIRPMDKQYARQKIGLNKHDSTIVSVGHTYLKGLIFLFRAFSIVVNKIPNAKLLMVGERGLPQEVKNFSKKMPDNIILVGEQPYEMIPYYLGAADILVLPMEDSPIERARWPIRLGDYLASGRPIVSNAVGEVKTVLEDDKCGVISPSDDVKNFAEKTIELMENEELRNELGQRTREVAEKKYDWAIITRKLANVYESSQI